MGVFLFVAVCVLVAHKLLHMRNSVECCVHAFLRLARKAGVFVWVLLRTQIAIHMRWFWVSELIKDVLKWDVSEDLSAVLVQSTQNERDYFKS